MAMVGYAGGDVELGVSNKVLESARAGYRRFLDRCEDRPGVFRLTPYSDITPYGLCFGLFGLWLLREEKALRAGREVFIANLRNNIRRIRSQYCEIPADKPYRQLLTFTLSALALLGALEDDPLEDLVVEQVPRDMAAQLEQAGAIEGRPQSGNQSMFLAIFLLHVRDYVGRQVDDLLTQWVDLHLSRMNRFGFWSGSRGMTHLQFQNGYHQYEIIEYLEIENPRLRAAVDAVGSLADPEGHFAPYPGGGGCYDYDAVFILTPKGRVPDAETAALLHRTAMTLLNEQTAEGGWGESLYVRPRSPLQLTRFAIHVLRVLDRPGLFLERLRYAMALQRPYHNRIHTHWCRYSRSWYEPDLWDSWFRLLTLARIQVAFEPERANDWGFISYPGIGYHPSLATASQS